MLTTGRKARITMADVAKAAGCSQATVSLVLNEVMEIKISPDLRSRVLSAARELGYGQASPIKRAALEGLNGNSVGFIVDQLTTTPEAINAIEGARQASWEQDVTILVAQTLDRPEREKMAVERLLAAGVTGIVYMSVFTRRIELNPILRQLPVPAVLLNCYTTDGSIASVVPDEITGGKRATAALIELGHTRIATIHGEMFMEAAQSRLLGYRNAHGDAKLAVNPDYMAAGNWTPSSGYDATRKLMSLRQAPTAIFCQNDKMALGSLNAILDMGLRVPDDVSLIGYDDDEICRHIRPQLSSVDLPHRTMGAWAIKELTRKGNRKTSNVPTKIECALINRASTSHLAKPARS